MARHPYRLGLAGGFALLVGIGLGRFAYTPVIPALVHEHWFTPAQAAYLGAVNLLGYMLGASCAHRLALQLGQRQTLGFGLVLLTTSLLACALNWGFAWYAVWRLLAGMTGAVLMVVAASAVIVRVPAELRPAISALMFTFVGVAIVAAGTIVPWLAEHGVVTVWLGVGLAALALALWSWWAEWRHLQPMTPVARRRNAATAGANRAVWLVIVAYGLFGIGIVPHSLFWVDFVARELGRGLQAGGSYWAVYGVGAAVGPALAGVFAARRGFRLVLVAALGISALAVALPLADVAAWALLLSSLVVGTMAMAIVALTSGAISELVSAGGQQQLWGWATLAFAVVQAAAAYAFSALYSAIGSYVPLFAIAAVALALASVATVGALYPDST